MIDNMWMAGMWMLWVAALMIIGGAFGLTLGLVSYGESAMTAWRRRHPSIEEILNGR